MLVTTLTKRMAEDLTDYLAEHGIKVRYLHSDIDTVERVEIIRDLRLGEFDVLVGINLLREGPRHSRGVAGGDPRRRQGRLPALRALADPDHRPRRAPPQRHARSCTPTGSPIRCSARSDETERRRTKQIAFNAEHGITPRGVQKRIKDIIDGVYDADAARLELKAAQTVAEYKILDEKALTKKIKKLEKEMLDAARNLEFEKAAELRDHLKELKRVLFGVEEHD